MKKIFFLSISLNLCLGWFSAAYAQEPNVSQYYHTPFLTNPGMIGTVEDVSIILNHRSQTVEAGKTYTTSTVSGYYPITLGNHRMGIGASFLSDRVADFMTTQGGMLGTAYSVKLSRWHELSLGAQAGFFNRKLNSSFNYTTDSQFINGSFNTDAPTGEVFNQQSRNFMTLSTGLFWQMKDRQGHQQAFAGGSMFNFNEPNAGFVEQTNLPLGLKATAGWRVIQGTRLAVIPNVRWIYQASHQMMNAGSWFRYDVSESIEYPQQISLGLWYNSTNAGVFAIEYEKQNYLVGLSYDIPMLSDLNTMQQGGVFEVALSFKISNKAKKQALPAQTPPTIALPQIAPKPERVMPVEKDKTMQKTSSIEKLAPLKEEIKQEKAKLPATEGRALSSQEAKLLARTVQFEFNNEQLDANAKEFLNEVSSVLQKNDGLKLEITGHTCNIGEAAVNQQISVRRAELVKQYLIDNGIAPERIITKGIGEEQPLASNLSPEGRVQNRRVDFRIIQ